MGFLAIVAVVQFLYCILAGNYPFNAFLSGFCAAVGQFVLTASLRMQTSGDGKEGKAAGAGGSKGKNARVAEGESGGSVSHERLVLFLLLVQLLLGSGRREVADWLQGVRGLCLRKCDLAFLLRQLYQLRICTRLWD